MRNLGTVTILLDTDTPKDFKFQASMNTPKLTPN